MRQGVPGRARAERHGHAALEQERQLTVMHAVMRSSGDSLRLLRYRCRLHACW